eukprot:29205-Pelagococcus_subviridis.AAC.2
MIRQRPDDSGKVEIFRKGVRLRPRVGNETRVVQLLRDFHHLRGGYPTRPVHALLHLDRVQRHRRPFLRLAPALVRHRRDPRGLNEPEERSRETFVEQTLARPRELRGGPGVGVHGAGTAAAAAASHASAAAAAARAVRGRARAVRQPNLPKPLRHVRVLYRGGVERPRAGRRDAPGKVLKDRRSPRRRGRTGTSVRRTRLVPLPLHDEPERGELARTVAHDRAAAVLVRAGESESVLKQHRVEPRERSAQAEVELLSHVHGFRFVLVGGDEGVQRSRHVVVRQRGESRAEDAQRRLHAAADVHDLERDVLALAVAVEPQDEPRGVSRFPSEVLRGLLLAAGHHLLHGRAVDELSRVDPAPLPRAAGEVQVHEVPGHGREHHAALLPLDAMFELPDLVPRRLSLAHRGAAVGEDARDFLRDGGLLRDVQDADGGHLGVAAAAERDPSPAAAQRPAVLGGAQFGCQENLKKTN